MILDFFSKRRIKRESLEALEQLMRDIVSDGIITDDEVKRMGEFVNEFAISNEDFSVIRERVFADVVAHYCSDRRISEAEKQSIQHIASTLNVGPAAMAQVESDLNYYSLLELIENVPFEELPHNGGGSGIQLQRGELDYFSHSAKLLEERVVRSQYGGGSQGISFRLMRGVSYRVGQSRGSIQSERAMVPISHGDFIITNQRLIFVGDRKSINAPFA